MPAQIPPHQNTEAPCAPSTRHDNEYRLNRLRVCFVGTALLVLIASGVVLTVMVPAQALQIWAIIGPMLASALTSLLTNKFAAKR